MSEMGRVSVYWLISITLLQKMLSDRQTAKLLPVKKIYWSKCFCGCQYINTSCYIFRVARTLHYQLLWLCIFRPSTTQQEGHKIVIMQLSMERSQNEKLKMRSLASLSTEAWSVFDNTVVESAPLCLDLYDNLPYLQFHNLNLLRYNHLPFNLKSLRRC